VLRAGLLKLGGSMLGQLLAADRGNRGPRVPCGHGHEAEFTDHRDKTFDTVLGPVTINRAWYRCTACKHGLAPRDAELGVAGTTLSPGLAAMNDKAAAAGPFVKAAGLLEDLAGVCLTAKRVERAAEASGAALAAAVRERAALITARKVVPLPPQRPADMLYGLMDGTGVPVTAKETAGRDGKGEDGRARTREVKLGVFFTQSGVDDEGYPVRDPGSASYIATFEPASVFGGLFEAEGIRRGANHVRQFTIIGDGAPWIWGIASSKFPEATQVVDLFHAREHLHDLARQLEFILLGRKGRMARRPPRRPQETRAGHRARLLREQRPPHALQVVPPVRPFRRLRRRRGRLQDDHRPAPQAGRNALDPERRRRHHRPALPRGQQHLGSHLQHPAHSDTHRLTSPIPKMILVTHEIDVHPDNLY
jgi:hypothetical protein